MNVLREEEPGVFSFHCPGCDYRHIIRSQRADGEQPKWTWNGNREHPTFQPSLRVRGPMGDPPVDTCCHSFIRNGQLQFLNDCTHDLAGLTVPMLEDSQQIDALSSSQRQQELQGG